MERLGLSLFLTAILAAIIAAAALDWIYLDSATAIFLGKMLLKIISWLAFWR